MRRRRAHPVPDAVEALLDRYQADTGTRPELVDLWPGQGVWVGVTDAHAVYFAHDGAALRRTSLEAARLRWARDAGVPVPAVIDAEPRWLVVERAGDDPPEGRAFAEAAAEAAGAIAAAPPPPPELLPAAPQRRAPRRTLPLRVVRLVAGGVSPVRFRRLAAAAAALPAGGAAHGDFQPANLRWHARSATLRVIDWELFGPAPRGSDLLTLWPLLRSADDRAVILDAARRSCPDPGELGALHAWLAMRHLADLVTERAIRPDRHELSEARARLDEAMAGAAAGGTDAS